jgi:hypothetical protein
VEGVDASQLNNSSPFAAVVAGQKTTKKPIVYSDYDEEDDWSDSSKSVESKEERNRDEDADCTRLLRLHKPPWVEAVAWSRKRKQHSKKKKDVRFGEGWESRFVYRRCLHVEYA